MTKPTPESAIAFFNLTQPQRQGALERHRDVVVTAGAGCGKTMTLVARYISLLAEDSLPRSLVAVTFTEKAAREMRSRVRKAVSTLSTLAASPEEQQYWEDLTFKLDSAHISTIHSLCTEILRAHPAEIGIDPQFTVLDEGDTALLRARVVEDTLATLVGLPEFIPLLGAVKIEQLRRIMAFMLDRRLESSELRHANQDPELLLKQHVQETMQNSSLRSGINELRAMRGPDLVLDAGDKLADQVQTLLASWGRAEQALAADELFYCFDQLYQARRTAMGGAVGKRTSVCREIVKALKDRYDELLDPLIGGRDSKSVPPTAEEEATFIQTQQLVWQAFDLMLPTYQAELSQKRVLDFDDLEDGAHRLLKLPEIRQRWQSEFKAIMVDEFQDTNKRQREIIEAISGEPGRLFIVGDARQSIYRFRRADVTVFRDVQASVLARGGLVVDLKQTYRTHTPLLEVTGDLLSQVIGTNSDPSRPYEVPFSYLDSMRVGTPEHIKGPHIELVLGLGIKAEDARLVAAQALAARLLELKCEGQIRVWDDVALLMRASSGFSAYEDAFERTGIPFVTSAGQGMYDRPEIRDVLNMLHALADPADDLALAGLLRSPAFGLSDAALYQLRWKSDSPTPYIESLQGDLSILSADDLRQAQQAQKILNELQPLVDRIPVAELLQRLVLATDYRAILAADDQSGAGGRLWRNLDKLLIDAQSSEYVLVHDFLDYIASLKQVSAREGEAPAEALGSVRIMSIHSAKGLEFPLVVLADASHKLNSSERSGLLLPDYGLSFRLKTPAFFPRLVENLNTLQDEAETKRLLYVALTRAMDKLIISGHVTATENGKVLASGWLQQLCEVTNISLQDLSEHPGAPQQVLSSGGHPIRALLLSATSEQTIASETLSTVIITEPPDEPLYVPLPPPKPILVNEDEPDESHPWRVASRAHLVPPEALGRIVHKALELWLFPGDERLLLLLRSTALGEGLVLPAQQKEAVQQATSLLSHFIGHPLYQEIDVAQECFREIPYIRQLADRAESGVIDVLYRTGEAWQVVDFKTDSITSESERASKIEQYAAQMRRYTSAIRQLLGVQPGVRLCFLDDHGKVTLVPFN